MGAFHVTKNSDNFEMRTIGAEISLESFQKIWTFLIFEKRIEFATNTEFQKFRETNKMERKFLLGNVRNLSKARDVVLFLR